MSQVETRVLGRPARLSWVVDLGVAVILVVSFWLQSLLGVSDSRVHVVGIVLVLVVGAAVLTRWMFPGFATAAALVATGVGWVLQLSTDPMLAAAWCLYPLALRRGARTRVAGLIVAGILGVCSLVLAATSQDGAAGQRAVIAIAALGASWLLGHVEARRLEIVKRAVQQQAAYDRAFQQTAMAREVHDVVGHALSVIRAEADIARTIPGTTDEEYQASLASIERRARTALEEVQGLVRALRTGDEVQAEAAALPELVAAAHASGLEVDSRIELPALSTGTSMVVSRVVQEALSNVVRHSGAACCEVGVWPEGQMLTVRVDDDGTGLPRHQRAGSGLIGMRERVEEAGGTLTVANRLEGGTRVLARLPLEEVAT